MNNKGATLFVNYQDSTEAWYTVKSNFLNGTQDFSKIMKQQGF
jgi:hypothetical protein